jgi:hypothetical protein
MNKKIQEVMLKTKTKRSEKRTRKKTKRIFGKKSKFEKEF